MKHSLIKKKIRLANLRNLIFPLIIVLIITLAVIYFFPFAKNSEQYTINKLTELNSAYKNDELYIETTIHTLYHTGHEHYVNGKSEGQYYYTLEDGRCYFFLLSNTFLNKYKENSSLVPPVLNDITVKAVITTNSKSLSMLINTISMELEWSFSGLSAITSNYIINELDFDYYKGLTILWIYRILLLICVIMISHSILCIIFPLLDPDAFRIIRYGSVSKQLKLAESEMSANILLKQGRFIITKHFLINLSTSDFVLMPLDKIVWAYKFSSYHMLRRRRRKITYTLFIYGKKRLNIRISHLSKSDANTILSYLDTNYPDILIGYRKEYEHLATKMATR